MEMIDVSLRQYHEVIQYLQQNPSVLRRLLRRSRSFAKRSQEDEQQPACSEIEHSLSAHRTYQKDQRCKL